MARRNPKREQAVEQPEPAAENPQPGNGSYAGRLREETDQQEARVKRMQEVNTFIRDTFRQTGVDSDEKMNRIISGLYERGLSDEEVSYVIEQKESPADGRSYMGYTFAEVNQAKNNLRAKQLQLAHLEGKGRHQAAEDGRGQHADPQNQVG